MSASRHALSIVSVIGGIVVAGLFCWWIITAKSTNAKASHAESAAKLTKVNEADLGNILLTDEAEQRIGIRVAKIEKRDISRVRFYGGEVIVPPGKAILVSAPMQGTLQAPEAKLAVAGEKVTKGQHILSLLPLFSAETSTTLAASRADVEGQLRTAQAQQSAMKLALDRAQRLYRDEAGSRRAVEESQAQFDIALRTTEAAQTRLEILTKALGNAATGRAEPIRIDSPEDGILRNVSALPGQNVSNGGALFEVVDLAEVWIRVPVYVGDQAALDLEKPAHVGKLSMRTGDPTQSAKPVQAPPSANPLSSTVDIYYAIGNDNVQFIPGERVGVNLAVTTHGDSLTVPWSAVLHDLQGDTWVYEQRGRRLYRRQRVLVRYMVDQTAVLAAGPVEGTTIVTEGAVELFGAETGFSK